MVCVHPMTAWLAAMLAVLIQPMFRFSDSQAPLHVLLVVGYVKFSGAGQYNRLSEGQCLIP